MSAKKLYTAVGRLVSQTNTQGWACPIVLLRGKEHLLDLQEMQVWSCLNWRLIRREELSVLYESHVNNLQCSAPRTLDACLDRLVVRGLVVAGYGETEYDALYDLLSSMFIIPVPANPILRLFTAAKLLATKKLRPDTAKTLFRRDQRTPCEKRVMKLVKQALLSTAEIILCMEIGVNKLSGSDSIVEDIYKDRNTTSDNISALVKTAPCTQDVTATIANLYLRQQIIFDRV